MTAKRIVHDRAVVVAIGAAVSSNWPKGTGSFTVHSAAVSAIMTATGMASSGTEPSRSALRAVRAVKCASTAKTSTPTNNQVRDGLQSIGKSSFRRGIPTVRAAAP